jgi:hypothetical protein
MDTVTILRRLWRFRLLVAVSALLAIAAGCLVVYKWSPPLKLESRKYVVGVATARILVDTPASQVVDVAPKGSDVLGGRATLLANLMVEGEIKSAIATKAGVDPAKLVGVSDSGAVTGVPADAPSDPRGFQLGTHVLTTAGGDSLPIIQVDAQAPDAAGAQRLATSAVQGLREYLDSKAAVERVPDAQRLRVSGLGEAQGRLAVRGPRLAFGVAATIFVFLLCCGAILMGAALLQALTGTHGQPAIDPFDYEDPFDPRDEEGPWPEQSPEPAWEDLSEPLLVVPPAQVNGSAAEPEPEEQEEAPEASHRTKRTTAWWGGGPG